LKDISQTSLTLIISLILIIPLATFIVSMLNFYQSKKHSDLEVNKIREKFNSFAKTKDLHHQSLIQSKLEVQAQTLEHIAKQLHSNISHLAALININLSEILYHSHPAIKPNVQETKTLTKQLMSELNALSVNNADYITHTGFTKAWEHELNKLSAQSHYKVVLNTSGSPFSLIPDREIMLFLLCQEVLNNILQHAKAKTITVSLSYQAPHLKLDIMDDGVGFNVMEILNKRIIDRESTGLIKIQKRAFLIKATVDIISDIGKGTHFIIDIYQ